MINFPWTIYQENIGILGMQGSGKTTHVKKILNSISNVPRLIVSPQKPTKNYGQYGTEINKISDIQRGAMVWNGDFSQSTFDRICDTLMSRMHDLVLVVDDVHEFCTKQKMTPSFNRLIQSGRNRGLCGIYISPSPNLVNNYILQSCQHIFSFRMKLATQIEWLEKNFFGNNAQLLIPSSLRNPKKPVDAKWKNIDILPKFSFLYRSDFDTETQLSVGKGDD